MSNRLEVVVNNLLSGCNASGSSFLLTVQCREGLYSDVTSKRILERVLINVGDSTTRYCGMQYVAHTTLKFCRYNLVIQEKMA